jgi:hypothetical protein
VFYDPSVQLLEGVDYGNRYSLPVVPGSITENFNVNEATAIPYTDFAVF